MFAPGGTTPYQIINNLEDIQFIQGSTYILEFSIYDGVTGAPVDVGSFSPKWVMARYGQPDTTVISKNGSITGTNTFEVTILPTDTYDSVNSIDYNGRFLHQPVLLGIGGTVYKPSQGNIVIVPKIPY